MHRLFETKCAGAYTKLVLGYIARFRIWRYELSKLNLSTSAQSRGLARMHARVFVVMSLVMSMATSSNATIRLQSIPTHARVASISTSAHEGNVKIQSGVRSLAAVRGDASVVGDDQHNAYVGTGGLLLPHSFTGGGEVKKRISNCLTCTWKYTTYCAQGTDSMCAHAVTTCPAGQIRYRVWFGTDEQWLSVVGSVCWGWKRPVTRKIINEEISQVAVRNVPTLSPGYEPPGGSLTSIPVNFHSGQPLEFRAEPMVVAGYTVRVVAVARWLWRWGDGSSQWTSSPGTKYPVLSLTHRYRKPGSYSVRVHTVWAAKYTVAGFGTFDVLGDPVTQESSLELTVDSSRVVLTPWE